MNNVCELCPIYDQKKEDSEIVSLKCGHTFCGNCINDYMKKNINSKIKCPSKSECKKYISDNIIRKILSSEDIVKYENFSLQSIQKMHNCLLKQCSCTISYTDLNLQYQCASCLLYNCVLCQASHPFYNCEQYQSLQSNEKEKINKEELDKALNILKSKKKKEIREILLKEDTMDVLINKETFTCSICGISIMKGEGKRLRYCQHSFCTACLVGNIKTHSKTPVKCPQDGCDNTVSDREIQGLLLGDLLEMYLRKCKHNLRGKLQKFLQCKQPDCDSLYHYTEKPLYFKCSKCNNTNCVSCNAVHTQDQCTEFKNGNQTNNTEIFIESQIKEKKLLRCLDCKTLLNKTGGCNWISCSNCGVELCWITQNYRWGPKGPGDVSGGCKCYSPNPCHPDCWGCIPDEGRRHARYRQATPSAAQSTTRYAQATPSAAQSTQSYCLLM